PPPPHLLPPSTQGHDDQKFGGSQEISLEGTSKNCRAKWNHQMKAYLIELLRDHDVPKYHTQIFDLSFTVIQVKQKEQDLKRDFKAIKDLISESGFGWDHDRKMVVAPDNVWLRYARGRSCHGMDYYANKATQPSQLPKITFTTIVRARGDLHTPTPTIHAWIVKTQIGFLAIIHSPSGGKLTQGNDLTLHTPQVEAIPISSQHAGQTLHENPLSLSMADMLKADIFAANKENREVFLSFSSNDMLGLVDWKSS
ncbi:hypothetical protein ZWY2020_048138, partial [Hordeum vulgare]